ncbi:PXDN [Branchiostoma lanceolatum]|uniref:PXDN protein n=1 Tax=Branchiostoma lanceolatum TaxID=7740 RepID=A0A8K0EY57_BRALA|nr:PXDN [Branchiostoma lanceolatum]
MFTRLIPMLFAAVAMAPLVVLVNGQTPSEQELLEAFRDARAEMALEAASRGGPAPEESPYSGALNALAREHRSTPMAIELSKSATVLEKVAKHLMDSSRPISYTVVMLSTIDSPAVTSVCEHTSMKPVTCPTPADPEFRSANGCCNNRDHPLWGSTEQPFRRLLEPDYDDNLMAPRTTGRGGAALPSARLVSTTVHQDLRKSSPVNTHMVAQFGQFLDHDITFTPNFAEEGLICTCDSVDEHCFNIPVPSDDPDFNRRPCLEFARSRSCPNEGCRMGRRQQLNQITAFVDASNVYGSSDEEIEELRDRSGPVGHLSSLRLPDQSVVCSQGWSKHGSRCFRVFTNKMNYAGAKAACRSKGGSLALPKDKPTNDLLVRLRNGISPSAPVWIGLNDIQQEGRFVWEDGQVLGSFSGWAFDEPNNQPRWNADCVRIDKSTSWQDPSWRMKYANKWRDFPCNGRFGFICEKASSGPIGITAAPARGLLKSRPNPADANKKEFLPSNMTEEFGCPEFRGSETCSQAGDVRVNEQPGLTSMHTVFLREHNRIARRLSQLNPRWDDDRVFFETRKIVGALMQKITYGEDLPHVLGPDAMTKFHLTLVQSGFFSGYDPSVDPTISNVFATAAYRFGHSLVQGLFRRHDPDFNPGSLCPIELAFGFFNPSHIFNNDQGGPDSIMRGLTAQPHQDFDRSMVSGLTNRLFADPPGSDRGLDLAALNIQRGRDHGLPGYNAWRVKCGLPKASSFDDLAFEIPDCSARKRLENVYSHVDDIDVFVGGLTEEAVPGGVVGPTFACLIGLQFQDLRKGDRFWFENRGQFTEAQLGEIRKTSLARILCDNTDGTTRMQPDVFLQPTPDEDDEDDDGRVACSSLPQMDLSKWRQ